MRNVSGKISMVGNLQFLCVHETNIIRRQFNYCLLVPILLVDGYSTIATYNRLNSECVYLYTTHLLSYHPRLLS